MQTHEVLPIRWGKVADLAISGEQLVFTTMMSNSCLFGLFNMWNFGSLLFSRLVQHFHKQMLAYGVLI